MSDQPETIDRLTRRLEDLEHRVDALEHPLAARWPHSAPEIESLPASSRVPVAGANVQTASLFALLGRAMLGIAGAYLLRAMAETGSVPRLAVAWTGIIYAFLWLVWAARTRAESRLAPAVYACTSALILAPMLWELTLSFKLLPAPVAAVVLGAYGLGSVALAGKRGHPSVLRVSLLASAALSLAMAIASHEFLPFICLLLLLAALGEFAPLPDRLPETEALIALAADAAIWTMIFIYFSPPSAHADYPQLGKVILLAPGILIFLIATIGVILQTMVYRRRIGIFATIQATIAFLLAAVSLADFGPPSSLILLGILCLFLTTVGYFAVFKVLSDARTTAIFAAWSAALLLSGCLLCFNPALAAVCLGAAAVTATLLGRQKNWISFELYGAVFLVVAAAELGLLAFIGRSIGAAQAGAPAAAAGLIVVCALLCYVVAQPAAGEGWQLQLLHLAIVALALSATAAFVIQALVALTALKTIPGAHHLAFIRTLTLCAASLALVFGGARWRRLELTRLGYATLVLLSVKLVAEDMRHGHLAYLSGSIFLFAVTLIAAPRVARVRQKA